MKKNKKIFSINAELGYRNYTVKDLQDIKGKIKLSQILVSTKMRLKQLKKQVLT